MRGGARLHPCVTWQLLSDEHSVVLSSCGTETFPVDMLAPPQARTVKVV